MDTVIVPKFKPKWENRVYLNLNYAGYTITNPNSVQQLKGKTITSIELVYTDYPTGTDLQLLTRKRLAYLYLLMPELFTAKYITWKLVKQTGAKNNDDARAFYHGFCITYREQPALVSELNYLKNVVSGKTKIQDSTILKVFNRHKDWRDMLVVVDVTGSMSPYTAQMLLWMKLMEKDKRVKKIVFFNDDDEDSRNAINLNDTKGVSISDLTNFDETLKVCANAMESGSHYENYVEAILMGLKACPDYKDVVIVADNYESPCDMNFLKEIKKPVKVVLCGVSSFVNLEHIEVAMSTKGSLHTMDQDLEQLYKLHEGEEIDILGFKFKVQEGKLLPVRK